VIIKPTAYVCSDKNREVQKLKERSPEGFSVSG
jgi:hypothetical protein